MEATGAIRSGQGKYPSSTSSDYQPMVAVYRARGKLRRFVCNSRLANFCSLTTRTWQEAKQLAKHFNRLRDLERAEQGEFPYAFVAETGEVRPHLHAFATDHFARRLLTSWEIGVVDIQHLADLESMRAAANYAAKGFLNPPLPTRYYTSRSFQPEAVAIQAETRLGWHEQAVTVMGGEEPTSSRGFDDERCGINLGWGPGRPTAGTGSFSADRADEFYRST
ncbi:MAG: hypothetical protein GY701_02595 [Sulfitobacter sp.]|nr:hypothetical protein [Sulfitobacter sp.]